MDAMVDKSMMAERFRAALISSFAAVGLLLAMLGVYGTLAYSVAQRTFEIGIRMAFGAEKATILGTILQHAVKLACCGIVFGLVLSLAAARLVTSMLVRSSSHRPGKPDHGGSTAAYDRNRGSVSLRDIRQPASNP